MKRFILLLVLPVLIGMTGCDDKPVIPTPVSLTQISKGNLYGNGQEQIPEEKCVIRSTGDWNQLIERIDQVNNVSQDFSETDIDFDQYMVIAIFDKLQMNGGHAIDITNIVDNDDSIWVKVKYTGPDGAAPSVITQPYCIAKIPRSDKPVIFLN
ncbi:protease complex subunit PrcB family protein [Pedobacter sp. BS3]|uniref:protease complex subunit PrcB family protein n=1 Tax=Pedobacter sp. BS3 TaxID=2567937 RepID=UPI0011F0904C|nr:protease complex subunit PrcB family protein [Pedobacter sp. BS3]TZF84736.1 protease complex subunit PrcB family protein [Pedobacter sp. BS3]